MALSHGKTIKGKRLSMGKPVLMKEPRARSRKSESLSDDVAESKFHYRNQFCSELKLSYPMLPAYWHVDKFYPMAEGGPLYVDEPRTDYDTAISLEKQRLMTGAGHRFVVIKPDMSMDDVLNQMIGVKP